MTPVHPIHPSARERPAPRPRPARRARRAGALRGLLGAAVCAVAAGPLAAAEDSNRWSLDLEAAYLDVAGLDRHVLDDRAVGGDASSPANVVALDLDTGETFAYRAELRSGGTGRWSWGADFLWYVTDQNADPRTGAAGGAVAERTFVVGGGSVVSRGPGEALYFERLEDTTVEFWTGDLVAVRDLGGGAASELRLLVGLRAADFDNDYRAVTGVGDAGGLRLDASSNYDRMHGPLVALAGHADRGRNRFAGYVGLAVVFGDVQLTSQLREFAGPPERDVDAAIPASRSERFDTVRSVEIPIAELRLRWRCRLGEHLTLGAGAIAQAWWNVALPPGVVAGARLDTLAEEDFVAYGLSLGATIAF